MRHSLTPAVLLLSSLIAIVEGCWTDHPVAPRHAPVTGPSFMYSDDCDTYQTHVIFGCRRNLTASEINAVDDAYGGMLSQYALGDSCHTLGQYMQDHFFDARVIPFTWDDGWGHTVTGDDHATELPFGSGRVHAADSVYSSGDNKWYPRDLTGPDSKIQTFVHEWAHLALGIGYGDAPDAAARLASRCLGYN